VGFAHPFLLSEPAKNRGLFFDDSQSGEQGNRIWILKGSGRGMLGKKWSPHKLMG
jgi:hypothetical protein